MPNRLTGATSPYLLQHADNYVAWRGWSEEAFAAAARRPAPHAPRPRGRRAEQHGHSLRTGAQGPGGRATMEILGLADPPSRRDQPVPAPSRQRTRRLVGGVVGGVRRGRAARRPGAGLVR